MKVLINGREYDNTDQPFIGDLRLLKKTVGFGYGTVIDRMSKLDTDANMLDLLEDDEFMEALLAWMWMLRLRAGERDLTWSAVGMTAIDAISFIGDEPEPVVDADPTQAPALTDSVPVGADPDVTSVSE